MAKRDAALVKRQLIAKANRTMFLWVVGASVIVGIAAVSSVFMVKKFSFNQSVINAKNDTVRILVANNEAVEELRNNVRVLSTNSDLASAKAFDNEETIRVVLDALPDTLNTPALGASIQRVLVNIDGIELDSLAFDDSTGAAGVDTGIETAGSPTVITNATPIPFSMKLNASSVDAAGKVLNRLEKSIRAINIKTSKMEMNGNGVVLTITADAYYQPPVTLELSEQTVGKGAAQ